MRFFAASPENRKILFGILFIAVILRAASAALFHPPLTSDDRDYDAIARSLANGGGFALDGHPTAFRPPGYPFLLAATYAVFGESKTPMRTLQVIADVFSCLLLFGIGKKMFSEKAGLVAAAMLAVFPIQILYISHLMTETIFTTVLLLIVWMVVHERNEIPLWRDSLMLGVLTGVGVLIRPTAALLPLVFVVYRWKNGIPFRANMRSFAFVAAVAFLAVSPWLARNFHEFHRASLTSNAGVNFWIGNHQGANGAYSFPEQGNPLVPVTDDFDRSDLGFKLGLDFIRSHPLEFLLLEGKKFAHFFAADYWLLTTMEYKAEWANIQNSGSIFSRLSIADIVVLHLPYVAVILLGTFGLVCSAKKDERSIFLLRALVLYWIGVHLIYYADARYRFPIVPIFILAASYGWFILREKTFQRAKMQLLTFTLICLIYVAGWLGEIFTLRSRSASFQPVAEQVIPANQQRFGIQFTNKQGYTPNTR